MNTNLLSSPSTVNLFPTFSNNLGLHSRHLKIAKCYAEALQDNIWAEIAWIPIKMLLRVNENLRKQLCQCVSNEERHLPDAIFETKLFFNFLTVFYVKNIKKVEVFKCLLFLFHTFKSKERRSTLYCTWSRYRAILIRSYSTDPIKYFSIYFQCDFIINYTALTLQVKTFTNWVSQ